jgi:Ca2+-transporting ATPase
VSWHTLTPEQTLALLESRASGLTSAEAARRLEKFGPNRLERIRPVPAWRVLLDQFASLVVLLLAVAALVALLLGDTLEAVAIASVLAINTSLGFVVELRARRAMDALLRYEVPEAKARRDGVTSVVPSDQLVPGDVIELEEGDAVPADARLLEAIELRTIEAPLTGESLPVDKAAEPLAEEGALLGDRTPMLFTGTEVVAGRAVAAVVHTGDETEIGRIGELIANVEQGKTPLEVRLDALGGRLVWLALGVAVLVVVLGVIRGAELGLMIETGLALAIAAVPEGLPAVATIALAVGLRRMARRHALVRRLVAVEALGATTVVCTDKTGTLTAGEMTVVQVATGGRMLAVTGAGYTPEGRFVDNGKDVSVDSEAWLGPLLEAAALTSRATLDPDGGRPLGDPTDAALTVLALKGGVDPDRLRSRLPEVEEIPFTSHRRSSATVHESAEGRRKMVKGAPSALLRDAVLSDVERSAFEARNEEMAAAGLRVIGLATGAAEGSDDLRMLGLVGILDPPAEGVAETISMLRGAGIRTIMVTGDQRATAEAIAADLGSVRDGDASMDGRDLGNLSDAELSDRLRRVGVLSRVSPEDKLRIVSALQAGGEVVAMIGDGVNDAAALKKADIGVAMGGRGTDVARQTAAMVLVDDRFRTIGAAVEEGRVIYDNIRKFVFYLFSCNVAEVMVLLGAGIVGLPAPLLPLQILWLNLVTDTFPALALALEPAEPDIMARPPRAPDASILSRRFVRSILFYAGLITLATLAAYVWAVREGPPERAITVAFMTLAFAQLFHLGNARSRAPVLTPARVFANPWALASVPLVIAMQLLTVTFAPLSHVLRTVPLGPREWVVIGALSVTPGVVGQLIEVAQARSTRRTDLDHPATDQLRRET